ncbi:molybdenum cofactor guanylyltransferase [Microbacterium sp. NPDC055910]|uniref:molybdenum cofactor guanylyltransferase n=1 Tax=Microbacterium sp. NPDC055910 TaxID=3345659 RepID=UPI0035E1336E
MTTFGAILVAGGRASRVGGATKPLFEVGGRTLLTTAVEAVHAIDADPVIVVAPVLDTALAVTWVREDPPFGGPAAGIVAALETWPEGSDPDWTVLLACDLPSADAAVQRLVTDMMLLPADIDGVCLADASARPQWLIGVYRTAKLRAAASALADRGRDAPVRALVDDLALAVISVADALTRDVDTWEDLARARSERTPTEEAP